MTVTFSPRCITCSIVCSFIPSLFIRVKFQFFLNVLGLCEIFLLLKVALLVYWHFLLLSCMRPLRFSPISDSLVSLFCYVSRRQSSVYRLYLFGCWWFPPCLHPRVPFDPLPSVLSVRLTHGMCLFFLAYWWTRARCHDVASLWVSRCSAYWRLVRVFLCLFVLLPWAHRCIFFRWGLHFPLYLLFSVFVEVFQQWMPRMLVHASTAVPFSYGGGILHRHDQFRRSHNTFLVALHTRLELCVPVLINSMVCVF